MYVHLTGGQTPARRASKAAIPHASGNRFDRRKKKRKEKKRKLRLLFYLDLVVEVAQLLAQFGVARLALVVEAALSILAGALVLLAATPAAPAVLARQLRFHRGAHAALLDRPLRIPPQLDQLFRSI